MDLLDERSLHCLRLGGDIQGFLKEGVNTYRQPGLPCSTPQNFAQSSKLLGKKNIFVTKVTSEAFLSISQNLKVTRLQGGTQRKV